MIRRYLAVMLVAATIVTATGLVAAPGHDNGNANAQPKMFGKGRPFTIGDLPPGRMRERIERLPVRARDNALEWLHRFDFPQEDLEAMEVDDEGAVLYVDPAPEFCEGPKCPDEAQSGEETADPTADPADPAFSASADDAFALHSRPGAPNVVFLDFDGHSFSGTAWSSGTISAKAFDLDGNPSSFSETERAAIAEIWHRVAEDFAAFDIDVTTEEPSSFGPYTGRVLITSKTQTNGTAMPYDSAGGVAYVGVWGRSNYASYYSPALVYYDNLAKNATYIAEASAHEFGHNLGLSHDGTSSVTYYAGHGSGATSWAPIMGNSYSKNVTQWSKGEYSGANNTQDDIAIIADALFQVADDHGDTRATATPLYIDGNGEIVVTDPEIDPHNLYPDNKGVIDAVGDWDYFTFQTGGGAVDIQVNPAWQSFYRDSRRGANLDVRAVLLDANGNIVAQSDPTTDTYASVSASVAEGTYFLAITGVGNGNYSTYASQGQYFISGTVAADPNAPPTADFGSACQGLSCSFVDSSTDSDGSIVAWSWDFGDGASATAQNPGHSYAGDGTYTVTLTVTDDDGATDTTSQTVTVSGGGGTGTAELMLTLSTDNAEEVYVNGQLVGSSSNWKQSSSYTVPLQSGENVIAVKGMDAGGVAGFIATLAWSGGSAVSDGSWKVSTVEQSGWTDTGFDDSVWANATGYGSYGVSPWGTGISGFPSGSGAQWIWSADADGDDTVYLRYRITLSETQNTAPTADFGSSCSGLSCSFVDSSTDTDGSIVAWSWDFGDGASASGQNPSHSYAANGTYTVTLTVTDDDGATDTTSQTVTVSGGGGTGTTELSLTLSTDNAEEVYVNGQLVGSSSNWKQSSSYTVPLQSGENVIAVKGMDAGGVAGFIATLGWDGGSAVSDGSWKVSTVQQAGWTATAFNDSAWANATSYGGYGISPWGTRVSGFPSGSDAQWIWSADADGDDTVYLRYRITLGETQNTAPTADFGSSCSGLSCSFSDTSTDSDGSIVAWTWDFGDGSGATAQNPGHSYAGDGTYTVALTVTDDDGATDTTSQTVTVSGGGGTGTTELSLTLSTDNAEEVYVNGQLVGSSSNWKQASSYTVPLQSGENIIAVKGMDAGGVAGFIATLAWNGGSAVSNGGWKVSTVQQAGWTGTAFNDSGWTNATSYGGYGISPWGTRVSGFPSGSGAQWIWSADANGDDTVYLRYRITM